MRKGSSEMKKDHFKIESHRKSSRQVTIIAWELVTQVSVHGIYLKFRF